MTPSILKLLPFAESDEKYREVMAIVHAVNKRMPYSDFRRKLYRLFGVRNVDELIDVVMKQNYVEAFIQKASSLLSKQVLEESLEEVCEMLKHGIGLIPFFSPHYPTELRRYKTSSAHIYPPIAIYVKPFVALNNFKFIAVVGTRKCSEWGWSTSYRVGSLISEKGYTTVTGLAKCVDEQATRGALESGGIVVGVRPWLEPLTLPKSVERLVNAHSDRVIIISEHYKKPELYERMLYYLRNRIIAGISDLIIVVEARIGGGSMHQIEWAIKRGKQLIIFEHPDKHSVYYQAFLKYSRFNTNRERDLISSIKSVEELSKIL